MPIRAFIWPQRLLLLGPAFDHALHAHHAVQFCVSLDAGRAEIGLRSVSADPYRRAPGFIVPADVPHQIDAGTATCALLYLDAEDSDARCYAAQSPAVLQPISDVVATLRVLHQDGGTRAQAEAAYRGLLGAGARAAARPLHPLVTAAVAAIRAQLNLPIRLERLAAEVGTSASWLSHRFSEETGLPLRRYVRWQRMWAALRLLAEGASLTQAAHAGGFSDSAHLSRTFRSTFGVAPSSLTVQRDVAEVHFFE